MNLSEKDFFIEVIEKFPVIKDDILAEDGLPHLQMAWLAGYTRECFERNDQKELLRIIAFVEGKIPFSDSVLYNTIGVSFVENLVFRYSLHKREEILKLLPKEMTSMYESLKSLFEK